MTAKKNPEFIIQIISVYGGVEVESEDYMNVPFGITLIPCDIYVLTAETTELTYQYMPGRNPATFPITSYT